MSEQKAKKPSQLVSNAAGALAGGIEAASIWPMEYIKTQLQLQERLPPGQQPKFKGMIGGLKYTVQTTGFFSLYRGLAPTLVAAFPKAAIRFGGNEYFKKILADDKGKLTPAKNFLCGLGAGATESLFVVTPVETIKTKLIYLNMEFVPGVKHIVATEGPKGLYQGLFATILKQGSNQGLRFMFFNEYKAKLSNYGERPLSAMESFLGGTLAGGFSCVGNNPFDVVKTRMQGIEKAKYPSVPATFMYIIRNDGVVKLWSGLIPRLGRVLPGQGIIFMSFESIQNMLAGMAK